MSKQLLDYFWNAAPDEILDQNVRVIKYGLLGNNVLLKVLPKYKVSFRMGLEFYFLAEGFDLDCRK